VNSLAAAIGPVLGGQFADFFATCELSLALNWRSPLKEVSFHTLNFQHWDFFFSLAFGVGLYSIHRLAKVKEVEEKIVIHEVISEIRRAMRSLSTAGGLRLMLLFRFSVLRQAPGPEGLKRSEAESTQDRGENTVELGEAEQVS
jgi:MFS family permease